MTTRLPVPDDPDVRRVLDRQVELMFLLATEVLEGVSLEECLWRPTPAGWTVIERDGRWFGELDEEPPNPPTPSLAWTMWHPIWWLSTLIARTADEPAPDPGSIEWPGPERSLGTIRSLWSQWITTLDELPADALESSELTRWPHDDHRPFVHVSGWASMELVKNLSEMCLLRRVAAELS